MSKKKEITTKKPRDLTKVKRALYIVLFSGSLATASYLGILVSDPDLGQKVLAGFCTVNALYFIYQAIK